MKAIEEAKKWLETDYESCKADMIAAGEVIGDLIKELEAHKEVTDSLIETDRGLLVTDTGLKALEKLNKDRPDAALIRQWHAGDVKWFGAKND